MARRTKLRQPRPKQRQTAAQYLERNRNALDNRVRKVVVRAKRERTLGPGSPWLGEDTDPSDDQHWYGGWESEEVTHLLVEGVEEAVEDPEDLAELMSETP